MVVFTKRIKGGFRRMAETELGEEQWCGSCGEFWPTDDEFFVVTATSLGYVCKACISERRRKRPLASARSSSWRCVERKLSDPISQRGIESELE